MPGVTVWAHWDVLAGGNAGEFPQALEGGIPEELAGEFPEDAYWQQELGVNLNEVERVLQDREQTARWLARQSDVLLSLLERGAGIAAAAAGATGGGPSHMNRKSKKERCERLLASGLGMALVRQALICRQYLANRRQDALVQAVRSIEWATRALEKRPVALLTAAVDDLLCAALVVAWAAPRFLPWFGLWDQALRVGYREYRLAGPGNGQESGAWLERDEAGQGAAQVGGHAAGGIDPRMVAGLLGAGGELRLVDILPVVGDGGRHAQDDADSGAKGGASGPDGGSRGAVGYLVLILQRTGTQRVWTLDGLQQIERARWIVLRFEDGWRRLLVHAQGELGVRVAETIAARALGQQRVSYRPHKPETHDATVAAWAKRIIHADPGEIRLYDVEVILDTEPSVMWRVYGEVRSGLARLARAAEATGAAGPGFAAGTEAIARGLVRVNLGFRASPGARWCRFTVRVRQGASRETKVVTFRGHGATAAEQRAFVRWMQNQEVLAALE